MKSGKRIILMGCGALMLAASGSCGDSHKGAEQAFPAGFGSRSDAAQVEYMMKEVSPDSVARFICDAALGNVEGAGIDTLAIAVAYAYEHYNDSSLMNFSREFDNYSANLPLPEKMRIYLMAGLSDPQRLGYELGLEYVNHIRENNMGVEDVKKELGEFRTACAEDTMTYVRFIKGFKTVLRIDKGKDLPEPIYNAFIDL